MATRKRSKPTGPDATTRVLVALQRAGGACERCRQEAATDLHHRDRRGMGGSRHVPWVNDPTNLVALCRGCHGAVEAERADAYRSGWLVRVGVAEQLDGVGRIPLHDLMGVAWILSPDGTKHVYTMDDYDPVVSDILRSLERN
jgi:hypothetical protein